MITAASLNTYKHKDLAKMAKDRGIAGWHGMRKAQLVNAILKANKTQKPKNAKRKPAAAKATAKAPTGTAKRPSAAQRRIQAANAEREMMKDVSNHDDPQGRDRMVLMVRGPYWLQVTWEVSGQAIERARAALAEFWHTAQPVLRLLELPPVATAEAGETILRVIEIHGAVNNWYIDVKDPPGTYRVELGYLASTGKFYTLTRSNVVSTPTPGGRESLEDEAGDVVENSERIFAMSGGYSGNGEQEELREYLEERLHRPLGTPTASRFGNGAEAILGRKQSLEFSVDAEMLVYGSTLPDAFVTMNGEPVSLNPDGSFTARISLPDRRQVLPLVASTRDGVEEQTIVLAVERNTKVMERKTREPV